MIKYVKGDILKSEANAIAHGVAPNDHFEHGLALSLREQWPSMVKDFRHWCHNQNPKPGDAWIWSGADGTRVVNLLTQENSNQAHGHHPGKAKTEYVNHALKALRKVIEKEPLSSVAIPKLATGVGGLSWDEVKPLIEKHLGDLPTPVFVYEEFHAGQKASET
ncbi:MAG: macro domain-containing protein [Pirellulaceae bacterium]